MSMRISVEYDITDVSAIITETIPNMEWTVRVVVWVHGEERELLSSRPYPTSDKALEYAEATIDKISMEMREKARVSYA